MKERRRKYSLVLVRCYLAANEGQSNDAMARDLSQDMPPMSFDTARRYLRLARALPLLPAAIAREYLAIAEDPLRSVGPLVTGRPAPRVDHRIGPKPAPGTLARSASRRATLQGYLQFNPTASVRQVAELFGVSISTAAADMAAYTMPHARIRYKKAPG